MHNFYYVIDYPVLEIGTGSKILYASSAKHTNSGKGEAAPLEHFDFMNFLH